MRPIRLLLVTTNHGAPRATSGRRRGRRAAPGRRTTKQQGRDDRRAGPARCRGRGPARTSPRTTATIGTRNGHDDVHEAGRAAPLAGEDRRRRRGRARAWRTRTAGAGPAATASQLRLPLTLTPNGMNTSTCSSERADQGGQGEPLTTAPGVRLATTAPTTPTTANVAWRGRRCRRSLVARRTSTLEADRTMTRPMTTSDRRRAEQQVVGGHRRLELAEDGQRRCSRPGPAPPWWTLGPFVLGWSVALTVPAPSVRPRPQRRTASSKASPRAP